MLWPIVNVLIDMVIGAAGAVIVINCLWGPPWKKGTTISPEKWALIRRDLLDPKSPPWWPTWKWRIGAPWEALIDEQTATLRAGGQRLAALNDAVTMVFTAKNEDERILALHELFEVWSDSRPKVAPAEPGPEAKEES